MKWFYQKVPETGDKTEDEGMMDKENQAQLTNVLLLSNQETETDLSQHPLLNNATIYPALRSASFPPPVHTPLRECHWGRMSFIFSVAFLATWILFFLVAKYDAIYAQMTYTTDSAIIEDSYVTYPSFSQYMQHRNHSSDPSDSSSSSLSSPSSSLSPVEGITPLHITASTLRRVSSQSEINPAAVFSVLLYGDSLIEYPTEDNDLLNRISQKLKYNTSQYTVQLTAIGKGGDQSWDLLNKLPQSIATGSYDAVIVFWDSDVSDQSVKDLSRKATQHDFKHNVRGLLSSLQDQYQITYIAVSGPALLGEGPFYEKRTFRDKQVLLDVYRSMNQEIAKDYSVPYINYRRVSLNTVPLYWWIDQGWITKDGEHPNDHGAELMSKYFSMMINKWISVP